MTPMEPQTSSFFNPAPPSNSTLRAARARLMSNAPALARAVAEGASVHWAGCPALDELGDVLVAGTMVVVSVSAWRALEREDLAAGQQFSAPCDSASTALLAGMLLSASLCVGLNLKDPLDAAARILGVSGSPSLKTTKVAIVPYDVVVAAWASSNLEFPVAYKIKRPAVFECMLDALLDALPGDNDLARSMLDSALSARVLDRSHVVFRRTDAICPMALFDATVKARDARFQAAELDQIIPQTPPRSAASRL